MIKLVTLKEGKAAVARAAKEWDAGEGRKQFGVREHYIRVRAGELLHAAQQGGEPDPSPDDQ